MKRVTRRKSSPRIERKEKRNSREEKKQERGKIRDQKEEENKKIRRAGKRTPTIEWRNGISEWIRKEGKKRGEEILRVFTVSTVSTG